MPGPPDSLGFTPSPTGTAGGGQAAGLGFTPIAPGEPAGPAANLPDNSLQESSGGRLIGNLVEKGNPIPVLKLAGQAVAAPFSESARQGLKDFAKGALQYHREQFQKADESLAGGDYIGWVAHSLLGGVPGSSGIAEGYEQMQRGDFAGGAGSILGGFVPFAVSAGASKAEDVAHEIAPRAYRSALKFGSEVPAEKRLEVSRRLVGQPVPPGAPPDRAIHIRESTPSKLKAREAALKEPVTRMHHVSTMGGTGISVDWLMQKVDDAVAKGKLSADLGKYPAVKKLIQKYKEGTLGGRKFLTPDEVQEIKEATDRDLRPSAFGERSISAAKESFMTETRNAAQEALEDVNDVQQLNRAAHLDIVGRKAIEDAMLNHPAAFNEFMKYGVSSGVLAMLGHTGWAWAAMAAGLARAAMTSPKVMGDIAIMIEKAGGKVPPVMRAAIRTGYAPFSEAITAEKRQRGIEGTPEPPQAEEDIQEAPGNTY